MYIKAFVHGFVVKIWKQACFYLSPRRRVGGELEEGGGNGGMSFAITKNDSSKPNYKKHMAFLA